VKITIESTTKVVTANGIQCRVWEGETASGIKVQCLIPRIAVSRDDDTGQFEKELQEQRAPLAEVMAFPLRMIL